MKKLHKTIIRVIFALSISLSVITPSVLAGTLGDRDLQYGLTGDDVKQLQIALSKGGYYSGHMDGVFGSSTHDAVKAFESKNELVADGIADTDVIRLLGNVDTKASRGIKPGRYKQALDIVATAYAPGAHDNGKWGNLTHIGTEVRPGVIAVDPKVIPLKSRVYIEFSDGTGTYAVAEDTGGAIKGNRIDIAMWTVPEAYKFGMQKVKVYVIE